jgi:cysteine desulfurase
MVAQLSDSDANPASSEHLPGQVAARIVAAARATVAAEFGCADDEVIFTSGATEANNLALSGIALAHAAHGRHIITSQIEHKAVLACCAALTQHGFTITYLPPDRQGRIAPEAVAEALRPDTLLISLMHTNNETGVHQPIDEVAALAAEHGVLLHVDAAQAAGKFGIDLDSTPIDLLSLSAHKFHGPKGIGSLIVRNRRRLRLQPLLHGGGQEFGLRPGTLAPHQIIGLSTALQLAAQRRADDLARITALKQQFIQALTARLPVHIHGHPTATSPYIVNFSIDAVPSSALIHQVATQLAMASGSACTSGAIDPSYVLRAMGIEDELVYGAVRLSFDRYHSPQDVQLAIDDLCAAAARIWELVSA